MVKFGHIELFVTDPAASAAFYENILGFEPTVKVSESLIWMQLGEFEILLRQGTPNTNAGRYEDGSKGIVLYTDDTVGTKTQLEARGLIFKETVDSDKCWTFTDPDGNWFQLVNPHDH